MKSHDLVWSDVLVQGDGMFAPGVAEAGVTVYVVAAPRSIGPDQVTVALPGPTPKATFTPVGAPAWFGTMAAGVVASVSPDALLARTLKVYAALVVMPLS